MNGIHDLGGMHDALHVARGGRVDRHRSSDDGSACEKGAGPEESLVHVG